MKAIHEFIEPIKRPFQVPRVFRGVSYNVDNKVFDVMENSAGVIAWEINKLKDNLK